MHQGGDTHGPFLYVPLREEAILRETVEDEGEICDRRGVGCEVELKPSFQPVVVHFMIRGKILEFLAFDRSYDIVSRERARIRFTEDSSSLGSSWINGGGNGIRYGTGDIKSSIT